MQSDSKAGGLVGVRAPRFSAEIDAELFNRAAKELAAFVAAVSELHGEEQARAAADDWLLELIALNEPCKGVSLDLRSVTIAAAIRLTRRLSSRQARGKQPLPAQKKVRHATTSDKISHAVVVVMAGVLLLAASAKAHAAHCHPVTQNKPANLVVIRWKSVSAKHEFQQDSNHTSKTSHSIV